MSQFIDSIKDVKRNWKTYDTWEQDQADDAAKRQYLSNTLDLPKDKVELTRQKTKLVLRASDMLDKRSEDNCENTERNHRMLTTAVVLPLALAPLLLLKTKILEKINISAKIINRINIAAIPVTLIAGIGFTLWSNSKQKEASRIGRFQAKQNELKDVKNFIIYTPEQIEAAKIVAKSIPDKKDDKSWIKLFAEMKQMSKDKVAYEKWLKDKVKDEDELQKVLNTEFTPEQIAQGQEDKEIVTNIVKDINIKAEEYSENMENAYDTMGSLSFFGSIPLAFGINKLIKKFVKNPTTLTKAAGILSPFIISTILLLQGTTQQKKAAQIGRFKKSQEILDNPEVLMNYSDEQMKQAQHIKAPKQKQGFFEDLLSDIKFFKTYLKDKKEYDNYMKTTRKEEEKLYEALKETDVSEKQLKDAKFLQQKTFMTFDKIDEMSQRYSEDTEAGTEIAKRTFSSVWSIIGAGVPLLIGYACTKGKIPFHKIAKTLSNLALEKNSSLRKTIDKAYSVISRSKALKEDVCKSIIDSDARQRIMANPEIQELEGEFLSQMPDIKSHLKKGRIATWVRNLGSEIVKLFGRTKAEEILAQLEKTGLVPKEQLQNFEKSYNDKFVGLKNYKTLFWTLVAGAVPILGLLSVPSYAVNAWLTNIQKKAGKIGIMKAMNELDNPQLYVNNTDENK